MILSPQTITALEWERAELIPYITEKRGTEAELQIAREIVDTIEQLLGQSEENSI